MLTNGATRLPADPREWPQPWRDEYLERLAIMEAEGVQDAARKAEADVRRQASGQGVLEAMR